MVRRACVIGQGWSIALLPHLRCTNLDLLKKLDSEASKECAVFIRASVFCTVHETNKKNKRMSKACLKGTVMLHTNSQLHLFQSKGREICTHCWPLHILSYTPAHLLAAQVWAL